MHPRKMTEMLDAPVREVCIQFTGSMRSIEAQHCCYLPAGRSPGGIFIFDVDQELSHLLTRLSYIRHHTFLRRMDNSPMSIGDRLRHAREAVGYKTATAAVEHFNWPNSTYRAHENGQNNFRLLSPRYTQTLMALAPRGCCWTTLTRSKPAQQGRQNTSTIALRASNQPHSF